MSESGGEEETVDTSTDGGDTDGDLVEERDRPPGPVVEVLPRSDDDGPFTPAENGPRSLTYLELLADRRRRRYLAGGVGLTSLGLALFLVIVTGLSLWGTVFLIPGVLLLALALIWKQYYWIYLPGFALAGFGIGWIVDASLTPSPDVWLSWIGLGLGLLLAYLLRRGQGRRGHWFPPVLGVVVATVGLFAGIDDRWQLLWKGWPLLIVAAGLVLVVWALLMGRRKNTESGRPPTVR